MTPRYYVTEVSGYQIDPDKHHVRWDNGHRPPGVSCSVLDRLYCHRDVATFSSGTSRAQKASLSVGWARKQARLLCDRLNAQETA